MRTLAIDIPNTSTSAQDEMNGNGVGNENMAPGNEV